MTAQFALLICMKVLNARRSSSGNSPAKDNSLHSHVSVGVTVLARARGASKATLEMAPVKSVERTYQKVIRSYNGDFSLVTDLVRCSVAYDTLAELADGMARLDADPQTVILQNKNRFDPDFHDRLSAGYKDVKLLVHVVGVTHGFVCEIQLHLKDIVAVKSGPGGHGAYVAARDAGGT